MKTLVKYISLLLLCRLMIPLTLCDTCTYNDFAGIKTDIKVPAKPAGIKEKPFSLIHDVIEKLLPAASFLK